MFVVLLTSSPLFYSVLFPHALGTNKISLSFLWGIWQIRHEDMCQLPPPPYIFIAQYESEPNIHSQCLALLLWIHHPSLHFTSHAHSTIRRFSRSLLPCPASDITFYCHARISLIFPQLDLITYSDCLILIYFILYYFILYYLCRWLSHFPLLQHTVYTFLFSIVATKCCAFYRFFFLPPFLLTFILTLLNTIN